MFGVNVRVMIAAHEGLGHNNIRQQMYIKEWPTKVA